MNPVRELKKIAVELNKAAQTSPYIVGGFYQNGKEFGREFWEYTEAKEYFNTMKDYASSLAFYKWEGDEPTEIDSWIMKSSKKKDTWPEDLKEGRFTTYCKRQGFKEGAGKACVLHAMKSDDPSVRGMAMWYNNTVLKKKNDQIFLGEG